MKVHYDEQFDVLEVLLRDPEPALTIELSDDVYLHVVPDTRQAIGLTVYHFRERHPQFAVPFRGLLTPIGPQVAGDIARALLSDSHGT